MRKIFLFLPLLLLFGCQEENILPADPRVEQSGFISTKIGLLEAQQYFNERKQELETQSSSGGGEI
ncbi:MAG: hypothetical protein AAFN65_13725 [Bacteroidota bacterium]